MRLGIGGTRGFWVLSLLAREAARRHSSISLELHPRTYSGAAARALRDEDMDLAIVSPPPLPGLDVHSIRQERVMLATPTDHRPVDRDMVSMGELRDQAFIS